MAILERDVLLQGQQDGQQTVDFPITRWANVEAEAEDIPELVDEDQIPVADASDQNQTKKTTWAKVKAALSGLFAAKIHTHSAGDIDSGMLPITRGGTGASTTTQARKNLGALTGVGPTTITLYAASWSGAGPWTQTVSVSGITASDNHLHIYPVDITDDAARKLYEAAYGCLAAQADTVAGGIKFTCRTGKPSTNFQVIVEGARA